MSIRRQIELWVSAGICYENHEYEEAIEIFKSMDPTSKIAFNQGIIYATIANHQQAVKEFEVALSKDRYLAVAAFQMGVSNFLLGNFEKAAANFNNALSSLRGNSLIDYRQLGLAFKLYACEILFNRGLCFIYMGQVRKGMNDLCYAQKEKVTQSHDVIDEAITEQGEGYTVFSVPTGVIYRPAELKVRNLAPKDFIGRSKSLAGSPKLNGASINRSASIAASSVYDDRSNSSTLSDKEFKQLVKSTQRSLSLRKTNSSDSAQSIPDSTVKSFAASNLVMPNLSSSHMAAGSGNRSPRDRSPSETSMSSSAAADLSSPVTPPLDSSLYSPVRDNVSSPVRRIIRSVSSRIKRTPSDSDPQPMPQRTLDFQSMPYQSAQQGSKPEMIVSEGRLDNIDVATPSLNMEEWTVPADSTEEEEFDVEDVYLPESKAAAQPVDVEPRIKASPSAIRLKIHFRGDTRTTAVPANIEFSRLAKKIQDKLECRRPLRIWNLDEEGDKVVLADDEDWACALSGISGIKGRLSLWVAEK
ncbi:hypothetical protein CANCADRAFT_4613 [Tortispora caseinolytica NRRL Y-17796]|uniref:PB1 domain-containing protein n=1 Tax=Tortispora caseinolytica NRRL Y-17796 TaxID=767744 RepID=A0A1E4T9T8_9ASCO|nr:hypothetical protein CANCADRAFT_4613 [Tortispora caseinolytica NRRL Y-17796]